MTSQVKFAQRLYPKVTPYFVLQSILQAKTIKLKKLNNTIIIFVNRIKKINGINFAIKNVDNG